MRILSLAPLGGPGIDALRALGDLEIDPWNAHVPIKLHAADELRARLDGVEILIVEVDHIGADVIAGSALRFIGVCRGDPVNVDVAAATHDGVVVLRTPGRNANAVADLALGLMLALLRSIVVADDDVRAGRFVVDGTIPQQRYLGRELASCTVGLVGFGAVGRATAARVLALGARVIAYDPLAQPPAVRAHGVEPIDDLGALVAASDIVSLHAPMSPGTRGMIDASVLALARPGTLLVNTARAGLVEEAALLDALRDGRIGGAGIDHFTNELLPPDHPFTTFPNVILTPHIGGSTRETVENHTTAIAAGIADMLAGRVSANVVNPEVVPASS